ncbi:MAG: hypothetical protein MRJ65_08110 [Candidatus Brocadiaceae bacterium]|nr:hypothetical protein [Candidatus Brocadiaceae bacterium]
MDCNILQGFGTLFTRPLNMSICIFIGLLIFMVPFSVNCALKEEIQSKPEQVHDNLPVNQYEEEQIVSEPEQLKKTDKAAREMLAESERGLDQTREMVDENQEITEHMDAADKKIRQATKAAGSVTNDPQEDFPYADVPAEEESGELAILESELDNTLAAFDEMLSKELERARANLRASQEKEKRLASELEQLKNSEMATPEMVEEYESELDRVQAMVKENQKNVDAMESGSQKKSQTMTSSNGSNMEQKKDGLHTGIQAGKEVDELAVLEGEMEESLVAFDEILLKEMEDIRAKSENTMGGSSKGADTSRTSGETLSGKQAQGEGYGEEDIGREYRERETEQEGGYGNVPVDEKHGEQSQSTNGTVSGKRGRPPYGSTQDDDIVARQLREAAEKETDPVLKEKLWKEYEEYKKGQQIDQ